MTKTKIAKTILSLITLTIVVSIVATSCSTTTISITSKTIIVDSKGDNCFYTPGILTPNVLTITDVEQDAEVNLNIREKATFAKNLTNSLNDDQPVTTYTLKETIKGISIIGSTLKILANALSERGSIIITILSAGADDLVIKIIGADKPDKKNMIVYDGQTYELIDNIDINNFRNLYSSEWNKLEIKDSGGQFVPLEEDKLNTIESVSIQSVSTDWDNKILFNFLTPYSESHIFLSGLTSVDLSGLKDATSFGNYFLIENSLKEFDGSIFTKLQTIGNDTLGSFYSKSSQLESVSFKNNSNLVSVGYAFCADCKALTNVDLSGWTNVKTIGQTFLAVFNGETSLKQLDLRSLMSLENIGTGFLRNCSLLEELWLPYEMETIPTLNGWGDGLSNNLVIHCGSKLTEYSQADQWKNKASQMVE